VHPKVLQVRVGHASAAETMDTYGHLYPDTDQTTRTAIDTAFRVASNVAENVACGFHHGRRMRRNRRSHDRCSWGAWDSNPQPTVKADYQDFYAMLCRIVAPIPSHLVHTLQRISIAGHHVAPSHHGRPARPPLSIVPTMTQAPRDVAYGINCLA
jgi:hypothetical protein